MSLQIPGRGLLHVNAKRPAGFHDGIEGKEHFLKAWMLELEPKVLTEEYKEML